MARWKCTTTTTTVLRPFFRDHPGELVPEENFWSLWCKRRLTEADTPTIRLGATPSKLTSAHLHLPYFLRAGCSSCRPTNGVKALKVNVKALKAKTLCTRSPSGDSLYIMKCCCMNSQTMTKTTTTRWSNTK